MKYLGSKSKHAKHILPIILANRKENQVFCDVFTGGANIVDKIGGIRIASDINPYLICLLQSLQEGWVPPDSLSQQEYNSLKDHQDLNPLVAFAGFGCSFGAKWFGGYARGLNSKNEPRNYALETKNNLLKQSPNLAGITFTCSSYDDLIVPANSLLYCDPPYFQTTKYRDKFDHEKFWQWTDYMINAGHSVFVSEYIAPKSWQCVWEKEVVASFDHNRGENPKKSIERLFTK